MNTEHEETAPDEGNAQKAVQQQQQQPETSEGHGGQGSDSAMKQMRVWEQRRASNSGGKRRAGPN